MYVHSTTSWDSTGWSLESDFAPAEWLKKATEASWQRWVDRKPRGISRVGDLTTYLYPSYLSISHAALRVAEIEPDSERIIQYEYLTDSVSSKLVSVLRHHTSIDETCWAAHWIGYGDLDPSLLVPPHLEMPARECVLGRGSFDWIEKPPPGRHAWALGTYSPEYWWPTDGAWLVSSDTDLDATYIGCSENAAAELVELGIDGLESVDADAPTIGH